MNVVHNSQEDEFNYWTGGVGVMPPELLENKRRNAMEYLASQIAHDVFLYNFATELERQFEGMQYTDYVKDTLMVFRTKFIEKIEEKFHERWADHLVALKFTPDEVLEILEIAKKTPMTVVLSGNKIDVV